MATTRAIKGALKSLLAATGRFGSIYTNDRERIENPNPASVVMWHDGGSQRPQAVTAVDRTTNILVRILVPQPPQNGEEPMQDLTDELVDLVLDTLSQNPTLDTGGGPLVLSAMPTEWDITYDPGNKRMVAEIKVAVTREEG